jgi:GNAT superfamily N-acetyltransferase
MKAISPNNLNLKFFPLTKANWQDFEKLFGERGACGGCWCMWWRMKRSEFELHKGADNKKAMRAIVDSGEIPGLLAYVGTEPIGWCSIGPREQFSALSRSRILKPIDDKPVWSIVCFFIKKEFRNQGVSTKLIEATIAFVKKSGGKIVEGYPVEPKKAKMPDVFAYTGLAAAFEKAGFVEVARRSETRPIMRFEIF